MNINADSILNEEEKEFLAMLAVNELESEGVVIESYDPESDNPFVEKPVSNVHVLNVYSNKRILELSRMKLQNSFSVWDDNPFTEDDADSSWLDEIGKKP